METFDNYKIKFPHLSALEKKEEFDKATAGFMLFNADIGPEYSADLKYSAWKQNKYLNIYYDETNTSESVVIGYDFVNYVDWDSSKFYNKDYSLIEAYEDIANGYLI